MVNILSESGGEERTGGESDRNKSCVGGRRGRGGEGEGGRRGGGVGGEASHANTDHDHHVGRI